MDGRGRGLTLRCAAPRIVFVVNGLQLGPAEVLGREALTVSLEPVHRCGAFSASPSQTVGEHVVWHQPAPGHVSSHALVCRGCCVRTVTTTQQKFFTVNVINARDRDEAPVVIPAGKLVFHLTWNGCAREGPNGVQGG